MLNLHKKNLFTPSIMNILEKHSRKLFEITEKFRQQKTIQDKWIQKEELTFDVAQPPFPWTRTLIFVTLFSAYCYCVV